MEYPETPEKPVYRNVSEAATIKEKWLYLDYNIKKQQEYIQELERYIQELQRIINCNKDLDRCLNTA